MFVMGSVMAPVRSRDPRYRRRGSSVSSDQVLEFLQFVEGQKNQSVRELLDKVLQKSRLMTGAEAGTIFIARGRGQKRWLEPASVQNDAIKVKRAEGFLSAGHKVKITMMLRGRENIFAGEAVKKMKAIAESFAEKATLIGGPEKKGKFIDILLSPK